MNNLLQKFLGILNRARGGESVLGIDVGSSAIKVVQLRRRQGQAVLETYGSLALGPYAGTDVGRATNLPVPKLAEALGDIIREAKVTTTRTGVAIPLSASLVSLIEFPPLPPGELQSMIPIEARRYIPVPISEVTLDWVELPPEEGGGTTKRIEVLLAAIHNDAITKYKEFTRGASLEPSFFEIEAFGTVRSSAAGTLATVMVFDMGASTTKLYLVDRGVIRLVHTVNRGSQEVTLAISRSLNIPVAEAERLKRAEGLLLKRDSINIGEVMTTTMQYVFAEALRVIRTFEQKHHRVLSRVVLAGGGVSLKGLPEVARRVFNTEVVTADPFSETASPAFLSDSLKEIGPEFSVAVGVALRRLDERE